MLNSATDAFKDVGEMATAYPAIVVPPRPAGILVAAIQSKHHFKGSIRTVRDVSSFRDCKTHAVCLGHTTPGLVELTPCSLTAATLDELIRLHPSPDELRGKKGAGKGRQIVVALWSDDQLDPDGYKRAKADHEERAKALTGSKETPTSHVERQAMLSQWRAERLPDPRTPFPACEVIGLLSDTSWHKE